MSTIEQQLGEELTLAAERLAGVIPALHPGFNDDIRDTITSAARNTAMVLTDPDVDDGERADTVIAIMNALWPHCDPPGEWWATPLGAACAMSFGSEQARSWSHSVAAAHLGLSPGTVGTLKARGTIASHPDGGLVPADVVRYGRERRRV